MAIDVAETGNKKISYLIRFQDTLDEDNWAYGFIENLKGRKYESLSSKQQESVGRTYNDMAGSDRV